MSRSQAPNLVQHEGVAHNDDFQCRGAARRQRYRSALQPAGAHVAVVRGLNFVTRFDFVVPPVTESRRHDQKRTAMS